MHRTESNRAVQPQKVARGLIYWIWEVEQMYNVAHNLCLCYAYAKSRFSHLKLDTIFFVGWFAWQLVYLTTFVFCLFELKLFVPVNIFSAMSGHFSGLN